MSVESPTISIRLPKASLKSLDKAVKATWRSRSYLMREALDHYLAAIEKKESALEAKPLSSLMAMRGIASKMGVPHRTAEEINAHIRWLRDSD